jgi:addiction module RelB/DinJ family antitoxin
MSKAVRAYSSTEPSLKERAEQVLLSLGIPVENAVDLFYHQIIMQNGMPFDVETPPCPLDIS